MGHRTPTLLLCFYLETSPTYAGRTKVTTSTRERTPKHTEKSFARNFRYGVKGVTVTSTP